MSPAPERAPIDGRESSPRRQRFVGLQWKGFLWMSCLLATLCATFYWLSDSQLMRRYHAQREAEVQSFRRQMSGLFAGISDRLVRLGGTIVSMENVVETFKRSNSGRNLSAVTEARFASLGYRLDVQRIEFYTPGGERLWLWTPAEAPDLPEARLRAALAQVHAEERPATFLWCEPLCLLHAFVPVLAEGQDIGVMGLGQSIADLVIEFRALTGTDIAIVVPAAGSGGAILRRWASVVPALTDADRLNPFLEKLSAQYPDPTALDGGRLLQTRGASFEVQRFPLGEFIPAEPGFILFISDVSARLAEIQRATRQGLFTAAGALAVGELLLFYLVRALLMSDLALRLIAENKNTRATSLDLGNCGLTHIPAEIGELVWLESVSLASEWYEWDGQTWQQKKSENSGNKNDGLIDIAPLAGLTHMRSLVVSDTQVTDLSPLAGLTALQTLAVSNTQVTDLAPLTGLAALQTLDVSKTQVTDLAPLRSLISQGCPVRWSSNSWEGRGIYVEGCPLINPPPEIVNQGNDAILNYFRERESGDVDHLYEAKMLILGEGGAGKTSLLRRLYQPDWPLPTEKESTKGISIYRHEFPLKNGRRFRLNVWDFGGQEIYHATHQFFLTRRSLYLLLDDTRKDHRSVSDEGFKYWLELVELFGGHSPVVIFQNEKGGRSKAIDFAGIKGRYDNVKECYAGNLEHANAADPVRAGIEFYASNLSHIGEQLPARWLKVRADIEARAAEVPHITQQEYFGIYGRHMEFDRSKALHLSRYLHDLGVFLHFQDDQLLARTVILQNPWATEAVFRILDDETVKAKLGRFNPADCERLWRDSVYANMHPELLALMQRFELCYVLADRQPQTWLAPQLLPPAKPVALADWGKPEDLVLRYRYDFLPKGMLSRLTVRLHRFVGNPEMAWVTGVLFERDATAVLVELLASGSDIELRARGPERKALLSVLAADLDALNKSFQGLLDKVDKRIPCNCKRCRTLSVPEFFAQKNLLKRKEDKRLKVECPSSYEEVDVLELLDGIRVDELPNWAKEEGPATPLRTIRIFLASSAELREDRDAFDLYFRQQNDQFRKEGLYLEIVRWENFLDAMSETRLQDEYNEEVRRCDIFVSLFFTKTGKFTQEEFDTAHRQFRDTGRPLTYTFFKGAPVNMDSLGDEVLSLLQFKKKLASLGHFHTTYKNIEDLKLQFRDQLDQLLG